MKPSRRDVLKSGAALLAGCGAPSAGRSAAAAPVVDTHIHCFAGPDDPRFPYHARAPYRPDRPSTPEDLLRCMDGAGVDHGIVVHPEPYQDDHRYLEHVLSVGRGRLKGTALFFADAPEATKRLAELAKRTPLVAARIHAYAPDRQPPFGKPELRAYWKAASDLGLAMQLHFEPRYAPPFEPLIEEFRSTTVLIDHLGRPNQGTPEEHARVVGWAKHPNAVVKLSSLTEPTQYPHRELSKPIRALADAFGPDRLLWGGGFDAGASPERYRAARERARALIAFLSAADQDKVLGGTAAKLFRFA
jgi:predicted TIM-barrel fold metal-dependent hydrolase